MSSERFTDIEWVAAQLRLNWRERQFLTDAEAIGSVVEGPVAKKRTAIEKQGGALSRFASEAALKHLQAAGWIRAIKVQKIDEHYRPAVGWMRLWRLRDILKAELALGLADYADLHLLSAVSLLRGIPGQSLDEPSSTVADVICEDWVRYTLFWFALESADAQTRVDAAEAVESARESAVEYPHASDPLLRLVDRRWLFGTNLPLPPQYVTGESWELLADVRSLANRTFDVEFLFDRYASTNTAEGRIVELDGNRVMEALRCFDQPVAAMELNLAQPLRRFLHRNRDEGRRQMP
ncbi:MAG: hypothetical protein ACXIVO_09060 [Glycocaulis sp.]